MDFVRKALITLFAPLMAVCLSLGLLTFAVGSFVGSPQPIKRTLKESGIYDHLVKGVVSQAKAEVSKNPDNQDSQNQNKEDIPFDRPEIIAAAQKALPPEFLEKNVEAVIDNVFAWISGDIAQPNFSIDVSTAKQTFVQEIAEYGTSRVASLPVCTDVTANIDDPFNATCKPADFNQEQAKQKLVSEAANNKDFLPDGTISASKLQEPKDSEKSLTEKLAPVQQAYKISQLVPFALAFLAILLGVCIFFLHQERLKGLKKVSAIFLSSGLSLLFFSLIAWFMLGKIDIAKNVGKEMNLELQASIVKVVESAFHSILTVIIIGAVCYVVVGIAAWFISRKLGKPVTKEQKQNNMNNFYAEEHKKEEVFDAKKATENDQEETLEKPDDTEK